MTGRHRPDTGPIHDGPRCCRGCWTPPGRTHGPACPAAPAPRRRLTYPLDARVWTGLLIGLPIGVCLYLLIALLIWSLT
ncbi:hypothetical protein QTQ03_25455 [Micromonospora sp. WMMA1363]|uniref:hypothetical protein n=1 Tax=Micromonospora sp. WMMA1363 TaxID=3053985 RepID=UPI00259C7BC1|nr:hypothetical protein [Micromonospora sp. WMMA1363]MDM4721127.1 hypothetical protein [Micromonospora sp. WMMA1363]MDM4722783.1 hypothetical protein [Micromonospora sp. WMMA1363]